MLRDEIGRTGEEPRTRGALVVALVFGLILALASVAALLKTYVPDFIQPDQWQKTVACVSASSLGTAIVVWIVLWFAVVRRRAPWRGFSYFLILVLVFTTGVSTLTGLFVLGQREQLLQEEEAAEETRAAIAQVSEVIQQTDEGKRFYETFPWTTGDARVIGKITDSYMHAVNDDVERERTQAHLFFHPGPVFQKHRLEEADVDYVRTNVAAGRTAIEEFWSRRESDLTAYRSSLANAGLSAKTRKDVLAAFDEAARNGAPARDTIKALDDTLVEKNEALVKAMQRYVSLQGGDANLVDIEEAANKLNNAIREVNAATDARNRQIEMGFQ